jgi:hypothetical protein
MNALNFTALKSNLGELIDRDSANSQNFLGWNINRAYLEICNTVRFRFLESYFYIQTVAEYSTGTVAVAANATAVVGTGTTFTEAMIGYYIFLNGVPYKISAYTDATNITIDRPYESTTALTAGSVSIVKAEFPLPYDCDFSRIVSVSDTYTPLKLKYMDWPKFNRMFSNPTDVSDPTYFIPIGFQTERYPAGTSYAAAAATTSTTQVVLPTTGSPSGVDNYYLNWHLNNKTRKLVSRITGYTGSTRVALCSPAVAAQAATDEFALEKKIPYVLFYPYPGSLFSLKVVYYKTPNILVNDWDLPVLPDRFHELIVWGAAIRTNLIMDDDRRGEIRELFRSGLNIMANEYGNIEGDIPVREAIDSSANDVSPYEQYKLPVE